MHRDQAFEETKSAAHRAQHRDQVIRERISLYDRELESILMAAYFQHQSSLTVDIGRVLRHQPLLLQEESIVQPPEPGDMEVEITSRQLVKAMETPVQRQSESIEEHKEEGSPEKPHPIVTEQQEKPVPETISQSPAKVESPSITQAVTQLKPFVPETVRVEEVQVRVEPTRSIVKEEAKRDQAKCECLIY